MASLLADVEVLDGMARALDERAAFETREPYAAELRAYAGVMRDLASRLRLRHEGELQAEPDTDPIAREAARVRAIQASMARSRYDDDRGFVGLRYTGCSQSPTASFV